MINAVKETVDTGKQRSARNDRILDAAEACFVRNGFHRSTMQDIAREAAMSAGNIYRYFDSKESIVHGMALREQERGVAAGILTGVEDKRAILMEALSRHYIRLSRSTAVLRVEIAAELARNPVMAELLRPFQEGGRAWFIETLGLLATSPDCDPEALMAAVDVWTSGAVMQRAVNADYDPAPIEAQLIALIDLGLAGRLPGRANKKRKPSR